MSEIDLENVIRYIVKEKNGKRDVLYLGNESGTDAT